jgi:hypothetical protein
MKKDSHTIALWHYGQCPLSPVVITPAILKMSFVIEVEQRYFIKFFVDEGIGCSETIYPSYDAIPPQK